MLRGRYACCQVIKIRSLATLVLQDFWEMFIHHIATLALLILSWTNHMHRMGSLVLLIHDFADHWLELAKLARYANFKVSYKFGLTKVIKQTVLLCLLVLVFLPIGRPSKSYGSAWVALYSH